MLRPHCAEAGHASFYWHEVEVEAEAETDAEPPGATTAVLPPAAALAAPSATAATATLGRSTGTGAGAMAGGDGAGGEAAGMGAEAGGFGSWGPRLPLPTRRDHAACVTSPNQFVVVGGFDGGRELMDLHAVTVHAAGGVCVACAFGRVCVLSEHAADGSWSHVPPGCTGLYPGRSRDSGAGSCWTCTPWSKCALLLVLCPQHTQGLACTRSPLVSYSRIRSHDG